MELRQMKTIRQPKKSYLCTVACCAMLTDRDLNYVLDKVLLVDAPDGSGNKYLPLFGAFRYLLGENYSCGTFATGLNGRKFDGSRLKRDGFVREGIEQTRALLSVESETIKKGMHHIVWDPVIARVRDPQYDSHRTLANYKVHDWTPVIKWEFKDDSEQF